MCNSADHGGAHPSAHAAALLLLLLSPVHAAMACGSSADAAAAAGCGLGSVSTRLRSPYTLSTRDVVGQNLAARTQGSG